MSFWRSQLGVLYCALLFPTQMEAQGTVLGQNNVGTAISYLFGTGGEVAKGAGYLVQLHLFDPSEPSGVGLAVGTNATVGPSGRFTVGVVGIPGVKPGQSALLVVRWWNALSNPILIASSYPIPTPPLGGDPDGNGPLLVIPPPPLLATVRPGAFAFLDASSAPRVYASPTVDGNYRLVAPALHNLFGHSLRFYPGEQDRFFRLAGATNAPLIHHFGPAAPFFDLEQPAPGLLRIIYGDE